MSASEAYDDAVRAFTAGADLSTEQRRILINAVWRYPLFLDALTGIALGKHRDGLAAMSMAHTAIETASVVSPADGLAKTSED